MKKVINKKEAATTQLETAIKLFFEHRDFISPFTLTAAADGILEGIWENEKEEIRNRRMQDGRSDRGSTKDEWVARLNLDAVTKREGLSYLTKHQNFFKHADQDHDQELEFYDFELTALKIFMAITNYSLIYDTATLPMTVFFGWYASFKPSILGPGNPLTDQAKEAHTTIRELNNEDLAKLGREALRRSCPDLFHQ